MLLTKKFPFSNLKSPWSFNQFHMVMISRTPLRHMATDQCHLRYHPHFHSSSECEKPQENITSYRKRKKQITHKIRTFLQPIRKLMLPGKEQTEIQSMTSPSKERHNTQNVSLFAKDKLKRQASWKLVRRKELTFLKDRRCWVWIVYWPAFCHCNMST